MSDFLVEERLYYIYAEYNPFFPYGPSWWLYIMPIDNLKEDGKMDLWKQATWLHYDWRLDALFEGLGLPEWGNFSNPSTPNFRPDPSAYCPAFMLKYPAGVVCQIQEDGHVFTPQESELIGDYSRRVRQRQLAHIAKAQEEYHKEEKD